MLILFIHSKKNKPAKLLLFICKLYFVTYKALSRGKRIQNLALLGQNCYSPSQSRAIDTKPLSYHQIACCEDALTVDTFAHFICSAFDQKKPLEGPLSLS